MNPESPNSSSINDSRCHHRYANGTRCRLPAPSPDARFCHRHAGQPQNQCEAADVAATLTAGLREFSSAGDVNEFLSRLLVAFAEDRISPRRAAVLAYITSQILRTISVADRKAEETPAPKIAARIICDIPRPPYERSAQWPPEFTA